MKTNDRLDVDRADEPYGYRKQRTRKRPWLALLVAFALVAAACGSDDPSEEASEDTSAATSEDTGEDTSDENNEETGAEEGTDTEVDNPDEAEPAGAASGTITLWGWSYQTMADAGLIDAFNAEYPDVTVEIVEYPSGDTYQNLSLAAEAGEGMPDIAMVENSFLASFVEQGALSDMTDLVEPYVELMNDFKWKAAVSDGRYYAMPWDSGPVVMYYRRDILEAAGLPSDPESVNAQVATWDGYLDMCTTIKTETGVNCFAHSGANNDARLLEMALWQQGLGYYDNDGNVVIDSADAVATLEKLGEFWDADVVSDAQPWTDPWYAELSDPDVDGDPVATITIASWMGVFLKTWIAGDTTAGLWGVAEMPAFADGQVRAANDGGSTLVIPEGAQNPEAAWAFIEFMLGRPENQLAIFEVSDFLPSLESTYSDPLFNEADDFFAGQAPRTIYTAVAADVPDSNIYGPFYPLMNGHLALAVQKYATGELSAPDALTEAAEAIRRDTDLG